MNSIMSILTVFLASAFAAVSAPSVYSVNSSYLHNVLREGMFVEVVGSEVRLEQNGYPKIYQISDLGASGLVQEFCKSSTVQVFESLNGAIPVTKMTCFVK
jgi:hypothetical protein